MTRIAAGPVGGSTVSSRQGRDGVEKSTAGLAVLVLGCLLTRAGVPKPNMSPDTAPLLHTERRFCLDVERLGIRDGFLAWLADDAIMFRPGPVNGRETFAGRPQTPTDLIWTPAHAEMSASGRLGFTTGPWELRPNGAADTTVWTGTYVTMWRLEASNVWRAAFDAGVEHPSDAVVARPKETNDVESAPLAESASHASADPSERAALLMLDRACGRDRETWTKACSGRNCRFLRSEQAPMLGAETLRSRTAEEPGSVRSTPDAAFVSGDLGYAYGTYERAHPMQEKGAYLRIWRKDAEGWAVVLEMLCPYPA